MAGVLYIPNLVIFIRHEERSYSKGKMYFTGVLY